VSRGPSLPHTFRLDFKTLPSTVAAYPFALFSKKPLFAPAGVDMPSIEVRAERVDVKRGHVARYRAVCGIPEASFLPPAYLHVLAMPLHMRIFTAIPFPVKVLGLVHLRNTIRQHVAVPVGERLQLTAAFTTSRETDSGQEYDIVTRAESQGTLVWEETSTMLARRHTPGKRPVIDRLPTDVDAAERRREIRIAGDTGRRYAWVSGDVNPIHMWDFTAARFGFKQVVAHGMWSLARTLGEVADALPSGAMQVDTQFKLPLYLPGDAVVTNWKRTDASGPWLDMWLSDGRKGRPHLAMQVR
jgi:acyl dehydratase